MQVRERIFEFMIYLCAIVGGVLYNIGFKYFIILIKTFTVSGIIDSIIHKSMMTILKKAEMGKLS